MRVTVIRWPNMCRQLLRKMTANVFSITEVVTNLSWDISAQQEERLNWFSWEPNTIIDDRGVPKPTLVHEEIRHVLRHENRLFGMVDRFTCYPLKRIFLRMPLSSVKGVIISWWKKNVNLGAKWFMRRPGFVNSNLKFLCIRELRNLRPHFKLRRLQEVLWVQGDVSRKGPKSNAWNYDALAVKRCSFIMFQI